MSLQSGITGEKLANALRALGVNFIMAQEGMDSSLQNQPARLIASLAESPESRLRLSLIPLFFEHPEFAAHVREASNTLGPSAKLTLLCYYSAAVWLARKYQPHINSLPDLFSVVLKLTPTDDNDENLRLLAIRHEELSGRHVNWHGTYEHAAQRWISQSKRT